MRAEFLGLLALGYCFDGNRCCTAVWQGAVTGEVHI